MMRKFRGIVQSTVEPQDKETIWYNNGVLNFWNNGGWVIDASTQRALDAAAEAKDAADKAIEAVSKLGDNIIEDVNNLKDIYLEPITDLQDRIIDNNSFDSLPNFVWSVYDDYLQVIENSEGLDSLPLIYLYNNLNNLVASKGQPGGIVPLNDSRKISEAYLPSYVDDVLEFDSFSAFPTDAEDGILYVAKDTNLVYRWSGTQYINISSPITIGTASGTAFDGAKGAQLESDVNELGSTVVELADLVIADKLELTARARTTTNSYSAIEKGLSTNITVSWIFTFNKVNVPESSTSEFSLKKGSTVLNATYSIPYKENITDATSYIVSVKSRGVTKTTTATINAYYPKYYGGSIKTTLTNADSAVVTGFTKQPITSSASGTHTVRFTSNDYLWLCVPSTMTINKVVDNQSGFTVAMLSENDKPKYFPVDIVTADEKTTNYKCYRSANPLQGTSINITIS